MHYNKLVRDNIIKKIEANGDVAKRHIAGEAEFELKLAEKLIEESRELKDSQNIEELKEELADIQEVIEEIYNFYGFSEEEIRIIQAKKREKNGGFSQHIILDETQ